MNLRSASWLGLSLLGHGGIFLVLGLLLPSPLLSDSPSVHVVELITLRSKNEPWKRSPALSFSPPKASLGRRRARLSGAGVDAIAPIRDKQGTVVGKGNATPQKALAGQDTSDLVSTPLSHPDQTLASERKRKYRMVNSDRSFEMEPTPFMSSGIAEPSPHIPRLRVLQKGARLSAVEKKPLALSKEVSDTQQGAARGNQGEQMSRIPLEGAMTKDPHETPQAVLAGRRRQQKKLTIVRKSTRRSVSAKRITDMIDMARPQGRGADTGRGRGTLFPRRGSPNGTKNGKPVWLSTSDRRYIDYFRGIYRKVNPLWLFPKELEIMMEQGDVLIQFTILKDGTVKNVRIRKSSGYPKFDQNVVVAILKAAPFKPIPNGLGQRLDILAPFEFSNPMVQ